MYANRQKETEEKKKELNKIIKEKKKKVNSIHHKSEIINNMYFCANKLEEKKMKFKFLRLKTNKTSEVQTKL